MKRCPECRRDYYDDTLLYCLDDGNALLDGPSSREEPATAIFTADRLTSGEAAIETEALAATSATEKENAPTSPASTMQRRSAFVSVALVSIFLIGGFFLYRYLDISGGRLDSVAVLPFANETANVDLEYLTDGVTETLISSLSQIENVSVKPRSSVFRFKGSDKDPRSVGKELAVDAVLTGRVAQRGDEMSLFVELVDVVHDKVIWSRQYSGRQTDLLSIQRNIAADVSGRLRPALSEGDAARVTKAYTANPEAYQHYLRGNYYREKWTEDGYKKAIEHYSKAIEIDPAYGLAYAGLAMAHMVSSEWFIPPREAAPRIEAAATKALELDPSLSEAHVALGLVAVWVYWDWPRVEREASRALELDPNNPKVHQLYGWYHSVLGRSTPAIESMRKAVAIEPLNTGMIGDLAYVLIQAGRVDEAMQVINQAGGLEGSDWWLRVVAALGYERKGQMKEALIEINRARELNNVPIVRSYLGYMLAVAGRTAEARQIVMELEELSKTQYVSPYYRASIYAGLNDRDAAFSLLQQADLQRCSLGSLGTEWIFDRLRPDPRFDMLLDRLNLSHLKK